MNIVNLKINGRDVQVPEGSSVLQAARAAGIDIPTLCHHPALANVGACRLCLVEVEKVPALQPACTYPVSDGLTVATDTPRTIGMRKFVLEMLFSERNHYCMFCEMSGNCELQNLAYRYGLDHWTYPTPYPRVPVDGTRKHFIMDHNRCILCRRCVRACAELVGNHTLGVRSRGAKTMICADMDAPLGQSTCVGCGTCLQACPTGALIDRASAYRGRDEQVSKTDSSCTRCSVGCATRVVTRSDQVIRVEGVWTASNRGVLCSKGRFEPLEPGAERISSPLVRRNGALQPASWDQAIDLIVKELKRVRPRKIAARVTGCALNETLDKFFSVFHTHLGAGTGTLEPTLAELNLPADGLIEDLDEADTILVVGADPIEDHRVVGYRIKREGNRDIRPLLVSDNGNGVSAFAKAKYPRTELKSAVAALRRSEHPVVVYGDRLTRAEAEGLMALAGHARFLALYPAANGRRARAMGLVKAPLPAGTEVAFVCASDTAVDEVAAAELRSAEFLAVSATVQNRLTAVADVVLPAPSWMERTGSFVNLEGNTLGIKAARPLPQGIRTETDVLSEIGSRI
jgi:formate dehydrogenase major subunit